MWEALQSVSTPVALIGFLIAAVASVYKRQLDHRIELLKLLPEEDRRRHIDLALESYAVRNDNMTREQKFQLLNMVLEQRTKRLKIVAGVAIFIAAIAGLIAALALLWPRTKPIEQVGHVAYRTTFITIDDPERLKAIAGRSFPSPGEGYLLTAPAQKVLESLGDQIDSFFAVHKIPKFIRVETLDFNSISERFRRDPHYFARYDLRNTSTHDGLKKTKIVGKDRERYNLPETVGFVGQRNFSSIVKMYPGIPPLFLDIMEANPEVPDLFMEELWHVECGGEPPGADLQMRPLKLLALQIENIGSDAAAIGSIEGITYVRPNLQLSTWDSRHLPFKSQRMEFPPAVLAPRESLLVPLRLILGSFHDVGGVVRPELFREESKEEYIIQFFDDSILVVPRKKGRQDLQDDYVLGSWFDVTTINGHEPLRRFERSDVVYDELGEAIGSCPYVFLQEPTHGGWVAIGTVITDLMGKQAEGESRLSLPLWFNGSLLLREVEVETSFIDHLALQGELTDGQVMQWLPKQYELAAVDEKYLTLSHGDEVLVEFPVLPTNVKRLILVSNGYFVTPENGATKERRGVPNTGNSELP